MTDEERTTPRPRESLLAPVVIPLGILAVIGLVLWGFSRVLLHVEPHVATATALVMAAAIVAIVAIVASRKRVGNGSLVSVVVGVAGAGMLASGAALLVGSGAEEVGPPPVTIALTAPATAAAKGYAEKTLAAPADEPFTIAFDNQEPQVNHNVVIASDDPAKDPNAQTFFTGGLVLGPGTANYSVNALPEGQYYFFCEVHPTTMNGTLTVAPGAAPAGGGPTTSITASGLAFDTSTLTFPASKATTITFQNNDAGTPHDLAIFTDSTATKELFKGKTVTGVASAKYDIPALKPGTYYFHCNFHPDTMNGTVTVGGQPPPSGAGPPPPSGATTVTASGLAFDVSSISLPAEQPSTITFDNQDAGVPHDIAIYTDNTASTALFTGEPVTGVATKDYAVPALPAGSYYFRCTFHPDTMNGTVTVA